MPWENGQFVSMEEYDRTVFPETAKSLFDPRVKEALDEMALQTCQVFNAINRAREREVKERG